MMEINSWLKCAEVQSSPGMLVISSNGAASGGGTNEAPGFSEKNDESYCV